MSLEVDPRRPGAAIVEGWGWRFVLPHPVEVRELPWSRASEWKEFVRELERDAASRVAADPQLPFSGGWVGFISYEAFASEEDARPRGDAPPEPAAFFARHSSGLAIAPDGRAFAFGVPRSSSGSSEFLGVNLATVPPRGTPRNAEAPAELHLLHDSLGHGAHRQTVQRIRDAILDGDVYQVNLTRAFTANGAFDAHELHAALAGAQPPQSSALLHGDGWSIVSASPEILLRFDRESGIAESLPIKGTMRRDGDDEREIAALLGSAKDAAEHLMIVDVVRNDFGKIAPPGCVSVREYGAVRTLEHVHHLETTVRAEGLAGVSVADVLAALSPAASITGAPKRAAVELIREVEPVARGVYCGAIGFIDGRRALLSVAIRTAVVTPSHVRYHAGGGIVWDSDATAEDDECRAKSAAFLRFVGAER